MSSRLPYLSETFQTAAQQSDTLAQWEKSQYSHYRSRVNQSPTLPDLLATAELAIRNQDSQGAQSFLDKALKRAPQEADAHYLKVMLMLGQEHKAQALDYLQNHCKRLQQKTSDHARLHRLLATQIVQQKNDLEAASSALKKAFELAGCPQFVHSNTATTLTASQFEFDIEVFDALWPWDHSPCKVRFIAVSTDHQDHLYVLEQRHRWVLCFDARGHFLKGLTERDLASAPFIFPELSWDLTSIALNNTGKVYLAGSSDRIYVFDKAWGQERFLQPPASKRSLRPLSMTIDPEGHLFVVYLHLGGIHWYNPEGYHLGSFGKNTIMPSLGKNYFCGLAASKLGVFLYDRESLQLFKPGKDQPLHSWKVPGIDPEAMSQEDYPFCWNGLAATDTELYICDTYGNRVLALNPAQGQFKELKTPPLSQPFDVAVDSKGTLYIADTGAGQILKQTAGQNSILLGHIAFQGAV